MNRKSLGATGLLIAIALLISINMISNASLRGAQLDLTEGKLYTLSDGTKNILRNLEEPIKLRFFFSSREVASIPPIANYGKRVRELLQEYDQIGGDMVELEIIEPRPFTEEEDSAVAAGIQGVPIGPSTNIYFGLEGVNSTDGQETIPFFDESRAQFLEYDVSQLVYNLSNYEKPVIRIVSPLPIDGGDADPMAMAMGQQPENEPWTIYNMLRQQYDVRKLPASTKEIPEETDVLMVIHPKELSEDLVYAIDQYFAAGGNGMIFVDPRAEVEEPPANPNNPMQAMFAPRNSNMPGILESLGLRLVEDKVVGDRARALTVSVGQRNRPEQVPYVLWMELEGDDLDRDEVATAQLQNVRLAVAGALERVEGTEMEISELLTTTEESQLIDSEKVSAFPDPKELLQEFEPEEQKRTIMALSRGIYRSAFDKAPGADEDDESEEDANESSHIAESSEPVNVMVASDVDLLADRFWVQVSNFLGQRVAIPSASNGSLVQNLTDRLSGSDDLVSIRGRGQFDRPFTAIEEMAREAQERFAEQEARLEAELKETQDRISELQQSRSGEGMQQLILSPEQEAELERFREKQVEIRKELRAVQAELNQDVENLRTRLKVINIGAVPLFVGLLAVTLGIFRAQRRRKY